MPTREELLRGTVKVNNERVNEQSVASRVEASPHGSGSERGDQDPGVGGAFPLPTEVHVPAPKESVWLYAARREREIRAALQEVEDQTSRLTGELNGLADERTQLEEELLLVTPLIIMQESKHGFRSSAEVSEPQDVLSDTGDQGGGRRSKVRGDGDGRKDTRGGNRKAPPNKS